MEEKIDHYATPTIDELQKLFDVSSEALNAIEKYRQENPPYYYNDSFYDEKYHELCDIYYKTLNDIEQWGANVKNLRMILKDANTLNKYSTSVY
jgi:hypothetical protein